MVLLTHRTSDVEVTLKPFKAGKRGVMVDFLYTYRFIIINHRIQQWITEPTANHRISTYKKLTK